MPGRGKPSSYCINSGLASGPPCFTARQGKAADSFSSWVPGNGLSLCPTTSFSKSFRSAHVRMVTPIRLLFPYDLHSLLLVRPSILVVPRMEILGSKWGRCLKSTDVKKRKWDKNGRRLSLLCGSTDCSTHKALWICAANFLTSSIFLPWSSFPCKPQPFTLIWIHSSFGKILRQLLSRKPPCVWMCVYVC